MPFDPKTKEEALVACQRCCCICHKFCGTKMEVAHIRGEGDGGTNTLDNAMALCFDCHADMRSYDFKHPKGNKYSESELRRHRDNWYAKVSQNAGVADRAAVAETDKEVYRLLVSLLPWNGSIEFVRFNNFRGFSFQRSRLSDLFEFAYQCLNPAFEFIDPDLEGLRATLLHHVRSLEDMLSIETFPIGDGWYSVPKEWEVDQPERFWDVVSRIHDCARQIVETYESLVRTGTRKLGVLPDGMGEQPGPCGPQ